MQLPWRPPGPNRAGSVRRTDRSPIASAPSASLTAELYFGSARQGRAALWVHVSDEANAKRAIRNLADHQVLHIRHYGHDRQDDLHIR
jgi:hypothetical protein